MAKYIGLTEYSHEEKPESIGILLVNLGSPTAPTTPAVRKYLSEFLSDTRMIEIPKPIWWCILHGIILRVRPKQSAKAYASIWTDQGSPLIAYSQRICEKLQEQFKITHPNQTIHVISAMRYGSPSIEAGIAKLHALHAKRVFILPQFPQYSAVTSASVFDKVSNVYGKYRWLPEIRFLNQYADHTQYITTLCGHLHAYWQQHSRSDLLLFSYHGLPKRNLRLGDPYYCYCQKTTRLIAEKLNLNKNQYRSVFQSRFGRAEWLKPYCEETLIELAKAGHKSIDIICPGFSADCLETLEEISIRYQETFIAAGGKQLRYIPALNDSPCQIQMFKKIISEHCHDWLNQEDFAKANISKLDKVTDPS